MATTEQVTIDVHLNEGSLASLPDDVRNGLGSSPKSLPPKYFYDARGSELFEQITELPEYYPTRAEQSVLDEVAAEIVASVEPRELVELGPGSARKTHALLDPMMKSARKTGREAFRRRPREFGRLLDKARHPAQPD